MREPGLSQDEKDGEICVGNYDGCADCSVKYHVRQVDVISTPRAPRCAGLLSVSELVDLSDSVIDGRIP